MTIDRDRSRHSSSSDRPAPFCIDSNDCQSDLKNERESRVLLTFSNIDVRLFMRIPLEFPVI